MPYGYDVANQQLPQAANPIQQLTQGGMQGIELGLGMQRAKQQSQMNQLQQQAAQQEMELKKINAFVSGAEKLTSTKNPILKDIYYQGIVKPIGSDMFGIEFPDKYDEKMEDYYSAVVEAKKNSATPEEFNLQLGQIVTRAKRGGDDTDDLFKLAERLSPKQPQQQTGSFIYAGTDPNGNLVGVNNKTFETKVTPSPTGKPLLPKNLTGEMANSSLYATRANDANDQLNALMAGGFDPTSLASGVQKLLPNYFQGEKVQALEQIGRNLGAAILRKESGAAITKDEWEQVKLQYIPQPGDKPETLKQKDINRQRAIQGLGQTGGQLPELNSQIGVPKFSEDEDAIYQEWKKQQLMGK